MYVCMFVYIHGKFVKIDKESGICVRINMRAANDSSSEIVRESNGHFSNDLVLIFSA